MAVARLEERARRVDGNKERGALDQFLVVQVPGVHPRRSAADAPGASWRSDAHASEKWVQRNLDAIGESRVHALLIQRNGPDALVRKILGQESAARRKGVQRIWKRQS